MWLVSKPKTRTNQVFSFASGWKLAAIFASVLFGLAAANPNSFSPWVKWVSEQTGVLTCEPCTWSTPTLADLSDRPEPAQERSDRRSSHSAAVSLSGAGTNPPLAAHLDVWAEAGGWWRTRQRRKETPPRATSTEPSRWSDPENHQFNYNGKVHCRHPSISLQNIYNVSNFKLFFFIFWAPFLITRYDCGVVLVAMLMCDLLFLYRF